LEQYSKPLPQTKLPKVSEEFWKGVKAHKLLIQQCGDCGRKIFYPRLFCTECLSSNLRWIKCSGRGKVYSYAVPRTGTPRPFANSTPYIIAVIKLDEGVTISSNIVNCKPEDVKCDMDVEAVFDDITEQVTLVKFKPVAAF
jgi:uncharacterized OB-fold protein